MKGVVIGICDTLGLDYDFVSVATWHSALGILKSKGDLKEQSINWVNERYNKSFLFVSKSSKKNEDDICDSISLGSFYLGNYTKIEKNKKQLSRNK